MHRSTDRKNGVVLLDTRPSTPEHEHSVHLKLAEGLARLVAVDDPHRLAEAHDDAGGDRHRY